LLFIPINKTQKQKIKTKKPRRLSFGIQPQTAYYTQYISSDC